MEFKFGVCITLNHDINKIITQYLQLGIHQYELYISRETLLNTERNAWSREYIQGTICAIHADKDFFDFEDAERYDYLTALNEIGNACKCNNILFHPQGNYFCKNIIDQIREILNGFIILFENTIEELNKLFVLCSETQIGLVYDISHACYHKHELNEQLQKYIHHYHIRGYGEQRYVSIVNSNNIIYDYLSKIKDKEDSILLLEYPYKNFIEFLKDYRKLHNYMLQG